jgi:hypothetical protein
MVKRRTKRALAPILLTALVTVVLVYPAYAASSVVHDPRGDATSPYLDIVNAKVTEQQGKETLFFMMKLAGPIPEEPSESDLRWFWPLDTNPATFPGGLAAEYTVRVGWNGTEFAAVLNDRTPQLTGGQTIETPIPFSVSGATVKAFVDLAMLGDPASFGWGAVTLTVPPPPPAGVVDRAPDTVDLVQGTGWATWTQ